MGHLFQADFTSVGGCQTNFPQILKASALGHQKRPLSLQLPWQLSTPPPQRLPRTLTHAHARVCVCAHACAVRDRAGGWHSGLATESSPCEAELPMCGPERGLLTCIMVPLVSADILLDDIVLTHSLFLPTEKFLQELHQ